MTCDPACGCACLRTQEEEIERLNGALRYIAAQAKAGHAGALRVIQSNAEAALDPARHAKTKAMLNAAKA